MGAGGRSGPGYAKQSGCPLFYTEQDIEYGDHQKKSDVFAVTQAILNESEVQTYYTWGLKLL